MHGVLLGFHMRSIIQVVNWYWCEKSREVESTSAHGLSAMNSNMVCIGKMASLCVCVCDLVWVPDSHASRKPLRVSRYPMHLTPISHVSLTTQ
jgi:hypothetical protein